jgi:hypothetical protein
MGIKRSARSLAKSSSPQEVELDAVGTVLWVASVGDVLGHESGVSAGSGHGVVPPSDSCARMYGRS